MAQNYYLMHHGVKGMKWGVRRTPEQLGHRKVSTKSDSVEERYSKAADARNDWVDRYDKLERDLSTGKIDYGTYERKAAKLDKEYEKIDKEYSDAAAKFLDKVYGSKEYKTLNKKYQELNAELKDAFDRNDDKRMMEIYDEMEKLESAVSELTKLKHGNHSADDYLMHYGVKGMKWGVRKTPEQLGYRPTRRTASEKSVLGKSTKIARRLATTSSSKIKEKISDPEFQRKVATGAKVALAIGAIYATHKIANSPQTIQLGKDILSGVIGKTGNMKASMLNSTEFKAAKAGLGLAKKGASAIGSENFRNTVTGIGALAGTVGILKNQLKGLREDKVDGDAVDKAVTYTKKISEIGESLNTIAQGPNGASSSSSSSESSSSSSNASSNKSSEGQKPVSVFTDSRTGAPIRANKKLSKEDKNEIKKYRANHPNLTLREALDELGWLDKDEAKHSAISNGWSFNPMAGCRYIF